MRNWRLCAHNAEVGFELAGHAPTNVETVNSTPRRPRMARLLVLHV